MFKRGPGDGVAWHDRQKFKLQIEETSEGSVLSEDIKVVSSDIRNNTTQMENCHCLHLIIIPNMS